MNASEILNLARLRLDDVVAPYLWKDEELLLYLNKAQETFARETRILRDDTTESVCDISVVANQHTYNIHTSILDILSATCNNFSLVIRTIDQMDRYSPGWREHSGSRVSVILIKNFEPYKVRLFPTPLADATLHLYVVRLPLYTIVLGTPDPEEMEADSPEIPAQYHMDLVHGILELAYLKRDSETYNLNESLRYKALFQEAIAKAATDSILMHNAGERFVPHCGTI